LKRICSQPLAQFHHRARPQACLLLAPRPAAAIVLAFVLVFGSAGCSYRPWSKNGNEVVERTGPIASETASRASEGDLAVARATVSEMLGKGGKTTSVPWEDPRTGARGTITPLASANTQGGLICHDFLASYVRDGNASWLQGAACPPSGADGNCASSSRCRSRRTEIGGQISAIGEGRAIELTSPEYLTSDHPFTRKFLLPS
jgi:hypothetical protein